MQRVWTFAYNIKQNVEKYCYTGTCNLIVSKLTEKYCYTGTCNLIVSKLTYKTKYVQKQNSTYCTFYLVNDFCILFMEISPGILLELRYIFILSFITAIVAPAQHTSHSQ